MAGSTGSTRSSVRRGRRLGVLGLLLAAALLLVAPLGSAYAAGDEGMDSFVAVYDLQPDGSMKVTETITWRFPSGQQKHGIFRDVVVRMGWNNEENRYRYYDMTDVAVSSPSGAPDDFRVSDNGAAREIRIGSADQYTSGTQVYKVSYTLHNVLNPITADGKPATDPSQTDSVELYYNVFGTNETTPRDRVSITVTAPAGSTKVACYQGVSRSDTPCQATSGDPARFSAENLAPGDAMSVLASYPPSAFGDVRADVRQGDSGASIGSDAAPGRQRGGLAGAIGAPVLALAVMGALVWTRGRDERYADLTPGLSPAFGTGATGDGTPGAATVRGGSPTVAVQFQPPRGVQPGMVGTIIDETANPIDVSATVIDLAVRGFLRIEEIGGEGVFSRTDWTPDAAGAAARRAPAALRAPAARRHLLHPGRRRAPVGAEEHLREHPEAHPGRDVPGGRDARVVPLLAPDPTWSVAGRRARHRGPRRPPALLRPPGHQRHARRRLQRGSGARHRAHRRGPHRLGPGRADGGEDGRGVRGARAVARVQGVPHHRGGRADRVRGGVQRLQPLPAVCRRVRCRGPVGPHVPEVAKAAEAANQPLLMPTWYVWSGNAFPDFTSIAAGVDSFSTTSTGTFTSTPGSSGSSGFGGGGFSGGGGGGSSSGSW